MLQLHLLMSFFLFWDYSNHQILKAKPFYFGQPKSIIGPSLRTILTPHSPNNLTQDISSALLTGHFNKRGQDFKMVAKKLYLLHAFTPSGMHLNTLIAPLKWLLPQKILIFLILLSGPFFYFCIPGQFALYRCWGVAILSIATKMPSGIAVIAVFLIELYWGSYQRSQLSFYFSYLFIGIVFLKPFGLKSFYWWMTGNILVQFFLKGSFSLLSFALGTLLSPLYALAFPSLLLTMAITPITIIPIKIVLHLIHFILKLTLWAAQLGDYFLSQQFSEEFILFLILIPTFLKYRRLPVALLIILPIERSEYPTLEKIKSLSVYRREVVLQNKKPTSTRGLSNDTFKNDL